MSLKKLIYYLLNPTVLFKRFIIFFSTESSDNFYLTLLGSSSTKKKNFNAIYDLNYNSRSFNFIPFLILCEIYRKKNAFDYFNIYILENNLPKKLQHQEFVYSLGENLNYRNLNLFPALCSLLPNCKSFHYIFERDKFLKENKFKDVFPKNYYEKPAINKGFDQPLHKFLCQNQFENFLRVPENINKTFNQINKQKKLRKITFTIRNSKFDIIRNTNQKQVMNIIKQFESEFEILIIPDVENPELIKELEKFVTNVSMAACYNLAFRLKLYETSFLNIFADSGPFELVVYSKKISYIFLKSIQNSLIFQNNYDISDTYDSNSQFKWATKKQIVISEENNNDSYIIDQINTFIKLYENN